LQIEQIQLATLIPYINNSRTHSDEQVAQIAASIKEFGFNNPVLVDKDNGIIAGHGRVQAARRLGLTEVPCVRLEHLTKTQRKAYIIADNRLALNAGWDNELLTIELNDLLADDFALELLGFDPAELKDLLDPVKPTEGLTDEDAVPEVPEEPKTKPGDIYQLGRHRLMCGDSTSIDAIDKLLNGNHVGSVVTDPPYGIGIDGQKESKTSNPKHNRKAHEFRGWDSERPTDEVFNYIVSLNVPSVIWGGNYFADILPASRGWLYWGKGQDGALTASDGELAWTNLNKPLRSLTVNRAKLQGSVHPTQKPLEVIEFSINYSDGVGSVLDLFGGSGSTMIACEKLGRTNFSMELDPKYCDVIVKRWEDFTGKKAELLI
jgi:hypothetical protein